MASKWRGATGTVVVADHLGESCRNIACDLCNVQVVVLGLAVSDAAANVAILGCPPEKRDV